MKMTNEEALNVINSLIRQFTRLEQPTALEGLKVAKDALERRIPKDVIMGDVCPNCGSRGYTETGDTFLDYRLIYCDNCGQRLKWQDEEE